MISASEPSETHFNRIDTFIAATIELRTTMRICFGVVGISVALMDGLLTFPVVQSFSTSAKVDRLTDQITAVRTDFVRLAERQDHPERTVRP